MQSLRYGLRDYECHTCVTIFEKNVYIVRITADVVRRHFFLIDFNLPVGFEKYIFA